MKKKGFVFCVTLLLIMIFCNSIKAEASTCYGVYSDKTESYSGSSSAIYPIGPYVTGNGTKGIYPTRKGAILITNTGSIGKVLGHVAIVYSSGNVVESLSSGVCVGKNNWNTTKKRVAASTPRTSSYYQDRQAADLCYRRVGYKYNFNYYNMSTRNTYYCSHLVWAAYKDLFNINLNTGAYDTYSASAIGPFEFVRSSGISVFPIYFKNWIKDDVTS